MKIAIIITSIMAALFKLFNYFAFSAQNTLSEISFALASDNSKSTSDFFNMMNTSGPGLLSLLNISLYLSILFSVVTLLLLFLLQQRLRFWQKQRLVVVVLGTVCILALVPTSLYFLLANG